MIDLQTLDVSSASEKPVEIELLHPATKEGLGQFISIIGKESKTAQAYLRAKNNEAVKKAVMNARRSRKPLVPSAEENEAEAVEFLALVTKGFRSAPSDTDPQGGAYLNYKGKLEYSHENVVKLYNEQTWIATQVDSAMADLSLFFTD